MNRPLKCMCANDHEKSRREILIARHFNWCTELQDATLKVLKDKDTLAAARRSFAYAVKAPVSDWPSARAKVQTYAQIHAWAVNGREGLPKRYYSESDQIVEYLIHGLPWDGYCSWGGVNVPGCSTCAQCFTNPYQRLMHQCARPNVAKSSSSVEENSA